MRRSTRSRPSTACAGPGSRLRPSRTSPRAPTRRPGGPDSSRSRIGVRQEGGPDLARATSWRDLDERLAALGFRLESAERGSGVVVTDGVRRASLSHVDRDLSGPKLAQRFGETFREYRARDPEAPAIQAPAGLAAR